MTVLVSELRLEEEIRTRHDARAVRSRERVTDADFEVVPALVGRIDAPETRPERELGERLCAVFLPRGAVEEIGSAGRGTLRWHHVILPRPAEP